jgi:uncharacterized tellurite resistance protein B-like protein
MNYRQYYIELANLIYAVAMADGAIQKQEEESFHAEVKAHLKPLDESMGDYGVDNAEITEVFFDVLKANKVDSATAFNSYLDFVAKNKSLISHKLKSVTLKIIETIADSYNGIEESEKELIQKVKKELVEI